MENINYESGIGCNFFTVAKDAKALSVARENPVQFEFNGIICVVNENTNRDLLYRDYCNARDMERTTVGPECEAEYSEATNALLLEKKIAREQREEQRRSDAAKKDAADKAAFEKSVEGVLMEFSDKSGWDDWRAKNTDGYGAAIFEYAEGWARLMQSEMAAGKTLAECAEATSFKLGFLGITGYMYGAAVSILSKCWLHGEQLRKWHNKDYGHDGEGVVNPAVLTVSTDSK